MSNPADVPVRPWFFMSYAREDDDSDGERWVQTLFQELSKSIARKVENTTAKNAGFLDKHDLKPGQEWADEIQTALATCRAFVFLMSPTFFGRPYCGREWTLFEERVRAAKLGGASLMIPIFWEKPELKPFPKYATALHVDFDTTGIINEVERAYVDRYRQGLVHIARRDDDAAQAAYGTIVEMLAQRILQIVQTADLPSVDPKAWSPLVEVDSKFEVAAKPAPRRRRRTNEVPVAYFAPVVASAGEIHGKYPALSDRYWDNDPQEWRPFEQNDFLELFVTRVTSMRGLGARWIRPDGKFLERIEKEEEKHNASVIMIDPRSIEVSDYGGLLDKVDRRRPVNCAILVLWDGDVEQDLQNRLMKCLWRIYRGFPRQLLRDDIASASQLETALPEVLEDLEASLAPYRGAERLIEDGTTVPSVSATRRDETEKGKET